MGSGNFMPFLVMVFVQVCYAGMNITSKLAMQSGMNPLVLVAYRQFFATIAIAPFGYWMERKKRASLYAGILGTALAFYATSWTIQRKGPLYVSIFSPLLLVVVAVLSWALMHEGLYVGTAIGSILIIAGLYSVLWGKNKEMKEENAIQDMETSKAAEMDEKGDIEKQSYPNTSCNHAIT